MTEGLTANGVALDSLAFMTSDSSGLAISPVRRRSGTVVPGAHGVVRGAKPRYEAGTVVLPLWIVGCLPDGSIPNGSSEVREFFARRDEILRLFDADTVTLDFTRPDGTLRRAVCETAEVVDFTRRYAEPLGRISVALSIFGSFWAELADVTASASLVSGGILPLSVFEPSNAPIADAVLRFGPGNNPSLIQGATYVAYDGIIPAGGQLVIDCAEWDAVPGPGTAWTPDRSKVRYGPGPVWFELDTTATPLQAVLTHTTGTGVAMDVSVTARRKFLTS